MFSARVLAVLAVVGACSRESPPVAAQGETATAKTDPLALEIAVLRGFRGEAHDVVVMPDGECIVALSWFVETDFGIGKQTTAETRRQSALVRYAIDGTVRWSTAVDVWPEDLAFDGDTRVLVAGGAMGGATTFVLVDAKTGAILRSGSTEGYVRAVAFSSERRPLVLSSSKAESVPVIDDVSDRQTRWLWRANAPMPLAIAASPSGGVLVTVTEVDDNKQTTVIAVDETGNERWRRALCASEYAAPILVDADGSSTVVACDPGRIFRLASDGSVRRELPVVGGAGVGLRPIAVAASEGRLVIGGQLLGEVAIGGVVRASWDEEGLMEKRGHGDAIVVVHDGSAVIGLAHGHGVEADQVVGVAAGVGGIWVVGEARRSLDFGRGKVVAGDLSGAGVGFVARMMVAKSDL